MDISINNIIIKGLFGQYDYNIREQNKKDLDISKLLILYGDNGCGKTTILKLVYNLLSLGYHRGSHNLSEIYRIKFNSMSIIFEDGYSFNATRNKSEYIGDFSLTIEKDAKIISEYKYKGKSSARRNVFMENGVIITDEQGYTRSNIINDNNKIIKIKKFLQERNSFIYYLTDKRKMLSTSDIRQNYMDLRDQDSSELYINNSVMESKNNVFKSDNYQDDILILTLRKAERWIRDKNILSSLKGDEDTNTIYKNIIRRISDYDNKQNKNNLNHEQNTILATLNEISSKSKSYSEFGLTSIIEYTDFEHIINYCSPEKKAIINQVLDPYVSGLSAKMDALKELYDSINTLVNSVNSYFNGRKFLTFHINNGFKILGINKDEIEPNQLSSGEQQLLLLFCNALLAKDTATIFIIDEPEISLNIKWQRKLIDSLLDFSKNGNVQYIIASHSMEILATHRNNVGKLEN